MVVIEFSCSNKTFKLGAGIVYISCLHSFLKMQSSSLQVCIAFIVLTFFSVESVSIAPVYSLPPTTKLAYPADNYAQLLTTPISMQAEANGGFAVLGKFFFASIDVNPWDKLFQLRNFNLQTADALYLQIQIYQSDTAANYRFQIWKDGSSCSGEFAKPATDNAWYSVDLQYDTHTGADTLKLKLNNILVGQTTCSAGWVENFQLNRVIVASQNWAGLRLYDSLLTDAEVASELDKICVPADTCADVLTAGCDTAPACPVPIAPVYSLPPTTKTVQLRYPEDNYVDLMTVPLQMQAETNGGMTVLGKFFFEPSGLNDWDKFFQLWNFDLETSDALHLSIMLYTIPEANTYRMLVQKDGIKCSSDFTRPTTENIWYTMQFQYSTVTDSYELKLNDATMTQNTCDSGFLQNFELNRVWVANQNWAGLRLYDSLLTDEEVSTELDKICVPADTCADVLTAGCDSPTAALCPAITPGPDPKDSKPASSAYHIDGGGWKLVRRVKAGSTWHPATDWLAGTDEYGTYTTDETVDDTFSIRYDHMILGNIDFLFATGDGTYWLMATREQIGGVQLGFSDYSSSPDYTRTFTSSTGKSSAVWYNRQAFNKDPMISQNDWGSTPLYMMYRGASVPEHTELVLNNNGMNVFIRTIYDVPGETDCNTVSVSYWSIRKSTCP